MRAGIFVVVFALAQGAMAEEQKRPTRVAVYNLEGAGVDERALRVMELSLTEEVRKLRRCSVISMDEVRALLQFEADRQMMGCDEDSCLAEIAEALGADALIVGGAARVGERVSISLKRINLDTVEVDTYSAQADFRNGEEMLAAVGPAIEKLFSKHELLPGRTRGVDKARALMLNPPPLPPVVFWSGAALSTGLARPRR